MGLSVVHSPSACKGRGSLDALIEFILAAKMKVFLTLCVLLSTAFAAPEADAKAWGGRAGRSYGHGYGYGGHGFGYGYKAYHAAPLVHPKPVAKCHTVYDTTYTTACKNVPERVCKAYPVTKYKTDYKSECHAVPEKVCHPVTHTVPDKVCHNHPERVCKPVFKTVYDTTYEEQCKDIEHKNCHESRVIGQSVHAAPAALAVAPAPIAPAPVPHPVRDDGYYAKKAPSGLAFTGKRIHKREAKRPRQGKGYAAPAPHCSVDIEHVCTKVPVKVARQVEEPHCTVVPKTVCKPTVREVVKTECHEEPKEVCHKVPIKVPYTVPVEKCKLVPNKVCKKVPHKHAREVCSHGYGYGHH